MSQEHITFELDREQRMALDAIAAEMNRDRNYLINEAILLYLTTYQWQVEEIQNAVAEAEAGDFATEEEVNAIFSRLVNGKVN